MDLSAPSGPAAAPDPATGTEATLWRDALSPELRTLTEITLAYALEAVVANGTPMLPFTVTESDPAPGSTHAPERVLHRFEGDLGAAVEKARAHAHASGGPRAAVAWDGWLTVSGIRQDAVVVQASERGAPGVVVAHRYRETLEGVVVVGKPVLVGPGDPVL